MLNIFSLFFSGKHGSGLYMSSPAGSHVLKYSGQKQDAESMGKTQQEGEF